MPVSVVKNKKDEAKWKKAEELAAKAGQEGNYAYIMGIYKKMKPDHEFKKAAFDLKEKTAARRRYTSPQYRPRVDSIIYKTENGKVQVLAAKDDTLDAQGIGFKSSPYSFPGGGIESDQTPLSAAQMEAMEEAGVMGKNFKLISKRPRRINLDKNWRDRQYKKRGMKLKGVYNYSVIGEYDKDNKSILGRDNDAWNFSWYPAQDVANSLKMDRGQFSSANKVNAKALQAVINQKEPNRRSKRKSRTAKIKSSFIRRIKYTAKDKTLDVYMKNRKKGYRYYNVPDSVFDDFKNADSAGKFLNTTMKRYSDKSKYMKKTASINKIARLLKYAAPAHIKKLRRLFKAGKMDEFKGFLKEVEASGKLKFTEQGTNIGSLQGGAESLVDIVVGVKGTKGKNLSGMHVRKVYDPKGAMYSRDLLTRKKDVVNQGRNTGAFADTIFRRGKGGANYSISPVVDTRQGVDLGRDARVALSRANVSPTVKARKAQSATGKSVSRQDILDARTKKRMQYQADLEASGLSKEVAQRRALKDIPEEGGSYISDLHAGNVFRTDKGLKVVDFNAFPNRDVSALMQFHKKTSLPPLDRKGLIVEIGKTRGAYGRNQLLSEIDRIFPVSKNPAINANLKKRIDARSWSYQLGGKKPSTANLADGGGLQGGPKDTGLVGNTPEAKRETQKLIQERLNRGFTLDQAKTAVREELRNRANQARTRTMAGLGVIRKRRPVRNRSSVSQQSAPQQNVGTSTNVNNPMNVSATPTNVSTNITQTPTSTTAPSNVIQLPKANPPKLQISDNAKAIGAIGTGIGLGMMTNNKNPSMKKVAAQKFCDACECSPCDCGWGNYYNSSIQHYEDEIKKIAVAVDPQTAAIAGVGTLSAAGMADEILKGPEKLNLKPGQPITIVYTDPGRGGGHRAQGKALEAEFKRRGIPVDMINIDDFADPKKRDRFNDLFKRRLSGKISTNKYGVESVRYYGGIDWKKFRDATRGTQIVNMHSGMDMFIQRHIKNPMYTIHTDQAPFKMPNYKLQNRMGSATQHIATRSAAETLRKEVPSIASRVTTVSGLPIQAPTPGPKPVATKGVYRITISGGALGIGVGNKLNSLLKAKNIPKNTVIDVVTGYAGKEGHRLYSTKKIAELQAIKARAAQRGITVNILGFAKLRDLMQRADLNIISPGGTTVTEARATGKPFKLFLPTGLNPNGVSVRNTKAINLQYKPVIGQDVFFTNKNVESLESLFQKRDSIGNRYLTLKVRPTGGTKEIADIITTRRIAVTNPSANLARKAKMLGLGLTATGAAGKFIYDAVKDRKGGGHWRKLPLGSSGKDEMGNKITGKTWVRTA